MANNTFDSKLDRMHYLMNYNNSLNENHEQSSNVEFYAQGADGKVYGILRENSKYVIKKTTPGNEKISESYDYLTDFMHRSQDSYSNYNDATKHLELKLMSLNEAYGKKCKTSTVNFNKHQESLKTLTEDARKELNRMHQIFENSNNIGKTVIEDPEGKAKETCPTCAGDPYTSKDNSGLKTDSLFGKDLQYSEVEKPSQQGEPFGDETGKPESDGEAVANKVNEGEEIVGVEDEEEVEPVGDTEEELDDAEIEELLNQLDGDDANEQPIDELDEEKINLQDLDDYIEGVDDEPVKKAPRKMRYKKGDDEANVAECGNLPLKRLAESICKTLGIKDTARVEKMVNEEALMIAPIDKANIGYGKKIGDGKPFGKVVPASMSATKKTAGDPKKQGDPFDEIVNVISDSICNCLQEASKKKN